MIAFRGNNAMFKRRNEQAAQRQSLIDARVTSRAEGRRDGIKERDDAYTLHVAAPKDRGFIHIGDQPQHEYVQVVLTPRAPVRFEDYARITGMYPEPVRTLTFRCLKKGWTADTGQTVVWWDWELAR